MRNRLLNPIQNGLHFEKNAPSFESEEGLVVLVLISSDHVVILRSYSKGIRLKNKLDKLSLISF